MERGRKERNEEMKGGERERKNCDEEKLGRGGKKVYL